MRNAWLRVLRFIPLCAVALSFTGCQEFQGPAWAPDGDFIAYTTYRRSDPGSSLVETDVYLVDLRIEDGEAKPVAKAAAFPRWVPDGPTLYMAGQRDARSGLYTAILSHRPTEAAEGAEPCRVVLDKVRLSGFQLSVDGTVGLLCSGKSTKPGEPQRLELWDPKKNERRSLREIGDVLSPALSPNGRVLAFAASDKKIMNGRPYVAVLELDRPDPAPKPVFPTVEFDEPAAATYVVHAFPDSERFLFYAPGSPSLWTVRYNGNDLQRYNLPKGFSSPLMVTLREDGRSATLTLVKTDKDAVQYHVFELDFRKGACAKLDGDAADLLGGHALDPQTVRRKAKERWAWLSAGGLALGVKGQARYFPQTSEQGVAAASFYLAQNDPDRALACVLKARDFKPEPADPGALDRAEARAYLAAGDGVRASEAFGRAHLLHPIGPDGLAFIFPAATGLPQQACADASALVKEMEAYSTANPKDILIQALRAALLARVEGKYADALAAYQRAQEVAPSEALIGGVRFQEAMTCFESGDMVLAGERWEAASRTKSFGVREYAAGLAAIAFALDGRPANTQRANGALQLLRDLKSGLTDDLVKLTRELDRRAFKLQRLSEESRSPDKTLRTWVDVTEYCIPQAFLSPRRFLTPGLEYDVRRIGASIVTSSQIVVAGLPEGTQTVLRIPRPVSVPVFAPNNDLLAFRAVGEVFPLPDTFCEAYVVDLRGTLLLGDPKALQTGALTRRHVLETLTWTNPRELRLKGTNVDAFGNQTALDQTLPLGPR
ncbi:MAG: hypothetical protein AMXMBFR7_21300 [Planctomycetota bacterium]